MSVFDEFGDYQLEKSEPCHRCGSPCCDSDVGAAYGLCCDCFGDDLLVLYVRVNGMPMEKQIALAR